MLITRIIEGNIKLEEIKNLNYGTFQTTVELENGEICSIRHKKPIPLDVNLILAHRQSNRKGYSIGLRKPERKKRVYATDSWQRIFASFEGKEFTEFQTAFKDKKVKKEVLEETLKNIRKEYPFLKNSKVYSEQKFMDIFEVI